MYILGLELGEAIVEAERPVRRLLQKPVIGWWWPVVEGETEQKAGKLRLLVGLGRGVAGRANSSVLGRWV